MASVASEPSWAKPIQARVVHVALCSSPPCSIRDPLSWTSLGAWSNTRAPLPMSCPRVANNPRQQRGLARYVIGMAAIILPQPPSAQKKGDREKHGLFAVDHSVDWGPLEIGFDSRPVFESETPWTLTAPDVWALGSAHVDTLTL
ncbi:hypothetical protein FZEAL_10525 [Fusarium zealandicum]|uniref:Uncharacterized protein n=1 Tax=Fusarium zealandicum TaxID=1053134 RepID=A0A8H4U0H8_9HYPO|nr:hypothetical protein FZEAL_10525 [Fusarium zealandicum]